MSASPPKGAEDRFIRLAPYAKQGNGRVFKIVEAGEEAVAVGLNVGDLIETDPGRRTVEYRSKYAVHLGGEVVLAYLGSPERRPKEGTTRGLHLQATWRINPDWTIPVSPKQFDEICIGQFVGNYVFGPPKAYASSASRGEADRLLSDEAQQDVLCANARKSAARAAGWRAEVVPSRLPDWARMPEVSDHVRYAPEGAFDLDKVVRKLLDEGRILYSFKDEESDDFSLISSARIWVVSGGQQALERARASSTGLSQRKADTERIRNNLDAIMQGLDGFLAHVDHEDVELFLNASEPPPEDDEKPWKWIIDGASFAINDARTAAAGAHAKLAVLRNALEPTPYGNDGAKDFLGSHFMRQMAFTWQLMTGETPGKTGKGRFCEFCRDSWLLMGWEAKPVEYFSKRIERGEHQR